MLSGRVAVAVLTAVAGGKGMTEAHNQRMLEAARVLGSQPLFILSTAGQELFHTNFLYWLAREHAEGAAEPVFKALGMPSTTNGQQSANVVRREYHHVDLYFNAGNGSYKLVLENKVAALVDPAQLQRYADKFKPLIGNYLDSVYTLLSLMPVARVPEPWRIVYYDDLVEPLRLAASLVETDFERQLVEHYAELVHGLLTLRDAVRPSTFDTPWLLSASDRLALQELRVLPLVEKLRGVMLAQLIRDDLNRPDLELEVGLSNSIGLVSYYSRPLARGHQVGWQLQGDQFRLAAATRLDTRYSGRGKRQAREDFVATEYADHFNFDALPDCAPYLGAHRARKEWLGYNPDFVYRYRPIVNDTSWEQVVALCAAAVRHSDR